MREGDGLESATIAAPGVRGGAKEGDKGLNGSHGGSLISGAVLGSTPYKLVHSSKTPVLVVRP
jgi:Universal stress protein family